LKSTIQKFGRSMMGPLSIIVAAGLLLGIVTILTNPAIVGETFANLPALQTFIDGVDAVVGAMFDMLPVLFAISIATGMASEDKESAAFAVIIGFILFHITINFLLGLEGLTPETTSIEYLVGEGYSSVEATEISNAFESVLGIFTYRMGIFGGIVVGLWTTFIHDRFHDTQLPVALSFFSGNRFVPIVIVVTIPLIAIASYFIWPYFNSLINGLGTIISEAGIFGPFIYGFSERLLIPTGLHHILNQLIRFTPIGGTATVDGETISGALTIFNAEMSSTDMNLENLRMSTRFLTQGYHPFMLFGLPGAAYAMYKTALPKQQPKIKGMLIAAASTAFLTGITEPIEFSFIFISPLLFIFHAFMAGLSFLLMAMMNVAVGNAGGGLIDLSIFGILQGTYTRWYLVVLVGIFYAIIYYFVFKYVIERFDVKTPGRTEELDENSALAKATNGGQQNGKAEDEPVNESPSENELGKQILDGLGGPENIRSVDNCISRLRLVVEDTSVINKRKLENTGSMGINEVDENNVHVVYGAKVENAAQSLKKELRKGKNN